MSGRGRVRISGGLWRGRVLAVPPGVRPTGSRVREALGSIWAARLPGARVLDLFAGSGAIGLEALSRGAAEAVLVDGAASVLRVLRVNCERLAAERSRVRQLQLPAGLDRSGAGIGRSFDLVFADPPYRFDGFESLLEAISGRLDNDGEAVVEHSSRVTLPAAVGTLRETAMRAYGESVLSFYRHQT